MLTYLEVRMERSVRGLSQEDFSKLWDISRQYLSEIEGGKRGGVVSKDLEEKYDRNVTTQRRFTRVDYENAAHCPYCKSGCSDFKVIYQDRRDPFNNTYRCRKCKRSFTLRHAWKIDEEENRK